MQPTLNLILGINTALSRLCGLDHDVGHQDGQGQWQGGHARQDQWIEERANTGLRQRDPLGGTLGEEDQRRQ